MNQQNSPNNATAPAVPSPTTANFIRLETDADRKAFYASLKEPRWWLDGVKKDANRGWVEIFKQTDWKCVYCSRDLATSTDALAESTEEHIVPRSLLDANNVPANTANNMAACCSGCNGLKAELVPEASHPCWATRKAYVKACSRYVADRRFANFKKYVRHVEAALKERATR